MFGGRMVLGVDIEQSHGGGKADERVSFIYYH